MHERTSSEPGGTRPSGWRSTAASVGLSLHGATLVLYAPSGLVAPDAGVAVLYAAWLLFLAVGIHWRRRHPLRVLGIPAISAGFWVAVVVVGDMYLGWTG